MPGCHSATQKVGQLESLIAFQSTFISPANSKNVGRPLKAIWRCAFKLGVRECGRFGITRSIDERFHFDFKDAPPRMEARGLDLTRG